MFQKSLRYLVMQNRSEQAQRQRLKHRKMTTDCRYWMENESQWEIWLNASRINQKNILKTEMYPPQSILGVWSELSSPWMGLRCDRSRADWELTEKWFSYAVDGMMDEWEHSTWLSLILKEFELDSALFWTNWTGISSILNISNKSNLTQTYFQEFELDLN